MGLLGKGGGRGVSLLVCPFLRAVKMGVHLTQLWEGLGLLGYPPIPSRLSMRGGQMYPPAWAFVRELLGTILGGGGEIGLGEPSPLGRLEAVVHAAQWKASAPEAARTRHSRGSGGGGRGGRRRRNF